MLFCLLPGRAMHRAFADDSTSIDSAVISEVMWMGSDLSTFDEWVEVACPVSSDCDLSGWSLTSLKSSGEEVPVISFATGALIPAGEARVISHYSASSSRLAAEPWMTTSSMSLPNSKLLLRLRDAAGTVRDEVDDGVGNPFVGANLSGGLKASMERIDLFVSGTIAENWRTADTSCGFKDGVPIFGTPGFLPTASASSSAQSSGESSSSSEHCSSLSSFASLSSISFLSSVSSSSSQSSLTSSASSVSSLSGSSVSSESSLSSDSSLSSVSFSSSISFVSSSSYQSSSSSASSVSSSASSRVEDPLLGNVDIFITEVLANPTGADTDEWIEIANLGAEIVNIAGWVLDDGNSSAEYSIPPRSGSVFFLVPGEYVSFRKSVTALPLDNSGERVSLMSGSVLIDAWEYPLTAEEVSFGRDADASFALHAFCVPTEGGRNVVAPLPSRIVIQDAGSASIGSAFVVGTEHVTLNLQAAVGAGSLASAACAWDFGDDAVSGVCNPPSHTFSDAGDYSVRLTVRDFCGGISVSTLSVTVLPEQETTASSSASSASSVSSASSSSSVSSVSSHSSISSLSFARVETGVILSEVYSVPIKKSSLGGISSIPRPLPPREEGELVQLTTHSPSLVERGGGGEEMNGEKAWETEEWIELFNPTDHEISLAGWIIDDLKDGGSKPWKLPVNSSIGAGEYLIFSRNETKLQLNDSGDDVWLIAPDDAWSDHVTIPKLKSGISFSFCDGEWRSSDPTQKLPNACETTVSSTTTFIAVTKKSIVAPSPAFSRIRYVVASQSSISSISFSSFQSGSVLMSYALSELPPSLTGAGDTAEKSAIPEAGALGALSGLSVALIWFGRKWWGL